MVMTSSGQLANDLAKSIYKMQRFFVDSLVKSGKIAIENADKEWAKGVAKELTKEGFKVSKKILEMMK